MTRTISLVRIGNSRGVRLPRQVIEHYQLQKTILLEETPDGIVLKPFRSKKLSLKASFEEMAGKPSARKEAMEWAESGLDEGLPEEDFSSWKK